MRFRFPKVTVLRLFMWIVSVPSITVFLMVASSHSDTRDFKVTQEVFFLVERGGKPLGEMVFGLFGETAPRTVKNFVTFATKGYKGLKYEGSKFHRVINHFMIQGGDVVSGDGLGSISIYGKNFADETMEIKFAKPGMLSMANRGPNTNGCQFFITTVATPWLNGQHVAFGKLVEGEEVMREIEATATDHDDHPLKDIIIYKSGRRPLVEAYYISDDPYNLRDWMKSMALPVGCAIGLILVFNQCMKRFDAALGEGDYEEDQTAKKKKELEKAKKKKEEEKKRLMRRRKDDDEDEDEEVETEEEMQEVESTEEEDMEEEEKEKEEEKKEEKKEKKKEEVKKDEGVRKRAGKGEKGGEKKK